MHPAHELAVAAARVQPSGAAGQSKVLCTHALLVVEPAGLVEPAGHAVHAPLFK